MLIGLLPLLLPAMGLGASSCPAVPNGIVLNKYYMEGCKACQRISPIIEEIRSRLEKAAIEVKYREIECVECDCSSRITTYPTLEITSDQNVTGSLTGFKEYNELGKWITETLNLSQNVFENHKEIKDGSVTTLVARDFLSGFDGQWLILFYEEKNDRYREYMKKIAEKHKEKLHVGEVSKSEAHGITNRFNVTEYPTVFALNHGTAVPYMGEKSQAGLDKFADRLQEPNFQSITYDQLKAEAKDQQNGEPLYVVLYRNFEVASYYFNDMAQQFKFRVKIFKSDDPALFTASGFHPQDTSDSPDKTVDHNSMVRLVLFKNGTFFPCQLSLDRGDEIVQWIFHTHFAHVTEISNDNFYTVFHGIKPALILITANEQYLSEFNKLSAERHLGTPYTNLIFAYIDAMNYPNFMKHVLPGVKVPGLIFYDPVRSGWFYGALRLDKKNFAGEAVKYIERYFANKLAEFPAKKSYRGYYVGGAWLALIIAYFAFRAYSERYKAE